MNAPLNARAPKPAPPDIAITCSRYQFVEARRHRIGRRQRGDK